MPSFKIDDLVAKTAPVNGDLIMLGDSADLVGSNKTIKKVTIANLSSAIGGGAGVVIKYLTNTDSPYTIADSDSENTFICDTSGGDIDIVMPTLADNLSETFEFIHQTGGNNLNIDGEGAETINEMTDIDLPKQGNRLKIVGTTSEWAILEENVSCILKLDGAAGYGSTDTSILRWTNKRLGYGNIFSENHTSGYSSNAEGLEITINKDGLYYFTIARQSSSGAANPNYLGFTLNSSQLTTDIESVTISDVLNYCACAENYIGSCSWSGYLEKDDVIRTHGDKDFNSFSRWHFTASYQGT